jgi:hypothetical protein
MLEGFNPFLRRKRATGLVARLTFPKPSRANYMALWRRTTAYNWRRANAESRARHRDSRREYDRRRYYAKRVQVLMGEWQRRQEAIEEICR